MPVEIKERPILFSGAMVRAILSGQKTVTRRIVDSDWIQSDRAPLETSPGLFHFWCSGEHPCPYGRPGERLWVRETWSTLSIFDKLKPSEMDKDYLGTIRYKASGWRSGKLRPSIFMPRWASRILLEITAVRVERLQDISEQQALAEGVLSCESDLDPDGNGYSPVELFSMLWSSINGTESWQANPWVWVVEFKRAEVAHG